MEFLEDGQVLKVKSVRPRDQGLYQCLASNDAGTQMRQFRLNVQGCFEHFFLTKCKLNLIQQQLLI